MIAGLTYYQICWYFLIFSFGGWVIEVAYHAVVLGKVVNRGFLNGPVCPVYGFGAVGIIMLGNLISADGSTKSLPAWQIFVMGTIVATLVELIAGYILDRAFHARWWDYTGKPFNFHGYICLEFSIIWGLTITFVIEIIYPRLDDVTVSRIAPEYGWWILLVLYILYLADLIVTVSILRGLDKKLGELDEIRKSMRIVSDGLSRTVAHTTIHTAQNVQEAQIQAALGKAELRDNVSEKKAQAQMAVSLTKAEAKAAFDEKKESLGEIRETIAGKAAALGGVRETLGETRAALGGKAEEVKDDLKRRQEQYRQQQEIYEQKLKEVTGHTARRLLKAFPTMKPHRYEEIIEKARKYINSGGTEKTSDPENQKGSSHVDTEQK